MPSRVLQTCDLFDDFKANALTCTLEEYCTLDRTLLLNQEQRRRVDNTSTYSRTCEGDVDVGFTVVVEDAPGHVYCSEDILGYCSSTLRELIYDGGRWPEAVRVAGTIYQAGNYNGTFRAEYQYGCFDIASLEEPYCPPLCQRVLVNGQECNSCETCLQNDITRQVAAYDCSNLYDNFTMACEMLATYPTPAIEAFRVYYTSLVPLLEDEVAVDDNITNRGANDTVPVNQPTSSSCATSLWLPLMLFLRSIRRH